MTRLGWLVALGIGAVVIIVSGAFIWYHIRTEAPVQSAQQATTTAPVNPSTLSIYTSGEYGFSLFYPSDASLTDAYSSTKLSSASIAWRVGASDAGMPLVRVKDGTEEVRVGMSTTSQDVRTCTDTSAAETANGAFTVGSTTWKKFSFQKVGTDNEQRITSYRTVHGSACYALELFQPLSGTASSTGYTLGDTITSFSFAE